jgi:hypothetical protein
MQIIGIGLTAYEIYLMTDYFINVDPQEDWITIIMSLSLGAHFAFIMLCQFVFLLVCFEAAGPCSLILVRTCVWCVSRFS